MGSCSVQMGGVLRSSVDIALTRVALATMAMPPSWPESRGPKIGEARAYLAWHGETGGGDPDKVAECDRVVTSAEHPVHRGRRDDTPVERGRPRPG